MYKISISFTIVSGVGPAMEILLGSRHLYLAGGLLLDDELSGTEVADLVWRSLSSLLCEGRIIVYVLDGDRWFCSEVSLLGVGKSLFV